jgi:hypothetical protein
VSTPGRTEAAKQPSSIERIQRPLVLSERLADAGRRLGASPADSAAVDAAADGQVAADGPVGPGPGAPGP